MGRRPKAFKGILVVLIVLPLGYFAISTVAIDIYEKLTASGSLSLSWDAPDEGMDSGPSTDSVGYMIYCWNAEKGTLKEIQLSDPTMAQYELGKLRSGTYQCAMAAIGEEGNQSVLSNVVTRTVQ